MESIIETPKLTKSDENVSSIDFDEQKWNCVTSQAFLKSYIQYLMTIDEKKDSNGIETVKESIQDGKRPLTEPSNSSDAKRLKLDCGHPSTGEYQLTTIIKTNDWHQKLCKCSKCLKMYQDYNIEFLFGIKNIEWLPTEILVTIFAPLLPSARRVASKCCKRFLEVWLCDKFIDDRRLLFDKCVLDPAQEPLSIFLKSSRNYQHLVFGEVIMRGESLFAGTFRENVTTIELMYYPNNFNNHYNEQFIKRVSLLSQFPNLKTIKVAKRLHGDFSNVPPTIESLVITKENDWYYSGFSRTITDYLDKTSDSFRIELNEEIPIKDIINLTESQRKKIQSVHLKFSCRDRTFKLPHFENLRCLKLHFDRFCNYGTEEILDNIEEQLPALKDLSINIWRRFPHKNWACLKTLKTERIPKEEMPRFRIFENLKKWTLKTGKKCFFVHEAYLNKNLKTLEIYTYAAQNSCVTCFETMTKSFPALENLTCDFKFTNEHLNALAKNTPKLKCCRLGNFDPSISFECLPNLSELTFTGLPVESNVIKTWPLMQHLRKLELRCGCFYLETVKIFEKMPALEDLRLTCDDIGRNRGFVFETLSKSLKRLKKIQIRYSNKRELRFISYHEIVDVMVENCKFLRYINFNSANREVGTWKKMLQKHSSLRAINGVWLEN